MLAMPSKYHAPITPNDSNYPAGFVRRLAALYHPDWGCNIRGKKCLFPGVRPFLTAVVAMHGESP